MGGGCECHGEYSDNGKAGAERQMKTVSALTGVVNGVEQSLLAAHIECCPHCLKGLCGVRYLLVVLPKLFCCGRVVPFTMTSFVHAHQRHT